MIVLENSAVPQDIRVWYEATTLRDAGWDVTLVCPDLMYGSSCRDASRVGGAAETHEGLNISRFRLTQAQCGVLSYVREYASAFISIGRVCWRIWRKARFDTIQFCNPPDIFFPIALFYRALGARIIFDHHDFFPEMIEGRFSGFAGNILYGLARIAEFLTFRLSHVVISSNESYRQMAIKRGRVCRDRVFVVRNGPKIDQFVPIDPDMALKRGFPLMACYAGVMGPEDGAMELLAAVRFIIKEVGRKDILFVFLGDGSVRAEVLAAVKAWNLESFVDMPGMICDNTVLRRYLSTADLLLSPEPLTPLNACSTFIKIGEYMAMGKPIVAFDLAETRITAADAAEYVEPADIRGFGRTILNLLDDPERRKYMGSIGRQSVLSQIGWEHQERSLLRAYEMAWAGRRRVRT
ncbi:MAG: glycosyltransferase family 4 protein [Candidatus Aminicenantales bacterium]